MDIEQVDRGDGRRWRGSLEGSAAATLLVLVVVTILARAFATPEIESWLRGNGFESSQKWLTLTLLGLVAALGLWSLRRRWLAGLAWFLAIGGATYLAWPSIIDPMRSMGSWARPLNAALYCVGSIATVAVTRGRYAGTRPLTLTAAGMGLIAMLDEGVRWWTLNRAGAPGLWTDLAGAALGLGIAGWVVFTADNASDDWRARIFALRVAAMMTLMVTGFVHLVYLGHEIEVPGANAVVRSHYTVSRLSRVADSWQVPATTTSAPQPIWARIRHGADFFGDEAALLISQRDGSLQRRDPVAALQCQRALQELYPSTVAAQSSAPAELTQQSRLSRQLYRWPRDLGPTSLVTGIDPLTLWLAAVVVASGLLLLAEAYLIWRTR